VRNEEPIRAWRAFDCHPPGFLFSVPWRHPLQGANIRARGAPAAPGFRTATGRSILSAPRLRFAPSPTGYLHVGGARTALFNWLYARKSGGAFLLRIEDTDRDRSSTEMTQAILDGMTWLGLDWDEGPVYQADGFEKHEQAAFRLLDEGRAYRDFLSRGEWQRRRAGAEASGQSYRFMRAWSELPPGESERRAAAGEPFAIRFRVPEGVTEWDDIVHGPTRFQNQDIEDFIILRTDTTPIYNLAVVCDDIQMRITHVLRGDDHLSNTPRQILLYQAFGAPVPVFGHLPMILGPDGKRLSKRHGATAVGEYAQQGIVPEALVNFLALLGWSPGDDREIMDLSELIAAFSLERILKKSSVFDPEKLEWMNGKYLEQMPADEVLDRVAPELEAAGLATAEEMVDRRAWFLWLVDLLKIRSRRLGDIVPQARVFLAPLDGYDPDAVARHWKDAAELEARFEAAAAALAAVEPWEPQAIEMALRQTAERLGTGFGKVAQPLRIALTGGTASPGIDQVIALLGRAEVARRIEKAQQLVSGRGSPEEDR
jgi:glutamyl-tRNA synthetase